jgi:hypothetical protein
VQGERRGKDAALRTFINFDFENWVPLHLILLEAASAQACTPNLLHSGPITYTYKCNKGNIKRMAYSKSTTRIK